MILSCIEWSIQINYTLIWVLIFKYSSIFQTWKYLTISPQILHASWMSFGMSITFFICSAHRLASSKRLTMYAFFTSCQVRRALALILRLSLCCRVISLIYCMNSNFLFRNPVDFWKLSILHMVTLPSLSLLFFLVESPDSFWPPFFFSFLSLLCFSLPSQSGTLQLFSIFVAQIYLFPPLYLIT